MRAVKDLPLALGRLGIEGLKPRADGRFSLTHDGDRRLDIHPLPDGRLVLEVQLAFLPEPGVDRDALLERAMRFSTACMPQRHDVVCLSLDAGSLLLQCEVPAHAGVAAVGRALEQFLNAADAWTSVVSRAAEPMTRRLAAQAQNVAVQP